MIIITASVSQVSISGNTFKCNTGKTFFLQRRAGESDYGISRSRRYHVRTELRSGDVFVGTVA